MRLSPITNWTLVCLGFLYLSVAADHDISATINLRVEGETSTIFEGRITTKAHDVTTAQGGTHKCDGTNKGKHPTAGPTLTGALDDAAKLEGFTWDGPWSSEYEDYYITRIGGSENSSPKFWGLLKGYEFITVGGCQERVSDGDQFLIAYEALDTQLYLRLPSVSIYTKMGKPVIITVTNGTAQTPVSGATVDGQTTDADGKVTLIFNSIGFRELKAEKLNAIRSNAIMIFVGGY
ncbi:hypothetical protein Q9L58_002514 [Maublancomyces gigas]|uniref:Uncharacterized protein n=1 Tax=Discina gigas TaxID=1032678 RepID=A0ABR3GR12_9PEZI